MTPANRRIEIARRFLLPLTFVMLVTPETYAQPATQLVLTNDPCAIQTCPTHPPPPKVAESGESFGIFVVAANSTGGFDPNYTGTVIFSSADPLATLPPPYTFLPGDRGRRGFTATLRTTGIQTIMGTDPGGTLAPGSLAMTVVAGPAPSVDVPTLTGQMKIFLAFLVGSIGAWLCRS